MALLTLCFLVGSILFWSIFGVFSVTVDSFGMILDTSGLVRISHDSGGKLVKVLVTTGSRVKKGDVLAAINQTIVDSEILDARQKVLTSANRQEMLNSAANLNALMDREQRTTNIVSTCDGVITEVQANEGDILSPGSTVICTIRREHYVNELTAVMYIPAETGKKVEPGMTIQLAPSGVDTNLKGSLMGIVRYVSRYPVSSGRIVKVLGNTELAGWIMQKLNGTVMEVEVDLIKDKSSQSGYLWTSVVGKHPPITSGSVCSGKSITERMPPLEKVFLKLSQWLRNS